MFQQPSECQHWLTWESLNLYRNEKYKILNDTPHEMRGEAEDRRPVYLKTVNSMISWTKVMISCLCLWELLLVWDGVKNRKKSRRLDDRQQTNGDETERHPNVKGMFKKWRIWWGRCQKSLFHLFLETFQSETFWKGWSFNRHDQAKTARISYTKVQTFIINKCA